MDTLQFYPTPPDLAAKMIGKFTVKPFGRDHRSLEPSAGDGALAQALVVAAKEERERFFKGDRALYYRMDPVKIDFIEVDMTKHAVLEKIEDVKGQVVGLDFLTFGGSLAPYTHVLMNPPFANGVHHILKAWEGLFDGEIVCLLNAETVLNPFSKERRHLLTLIEQHGDMEVVSGAFLGEGVVRKAEVEVAIVHLIKKASIDKDVVGAALDQLKEDDLHNTGGAGAYEGMVNNQQLAIPGDVIVRTERAFKVAVTALQESVVAAHKAGYLARLVGETLEQRTGDAAKDKDMGDMTQSIRAAIVAGYDDLKNRAWSEVLRSTKVSSKLSSGAQRRLESDFERIKRLDFSASNVYAFLLGLIQSQGDMHLQMALDCFDEITRYHEDNAVWYMGWKSNGKHRTAGRRIKMTRFILPGFSGSWGGKSLQYEATQRLADFDKVFEVLDGKMVGSTFGLANLFQHDAADLASGARLDSEYFQARWYPKIGTIHFFPKRKDLIDRLNRVVGRARQWLPEREDMVSKDFWLAYEQAEKFDAEVVKAVGPQRSYGRSVFWDAARDIRHEGDCEEIERARDQIAQACLRVASTHGLDPLAAVEHAATPQMPLLQAA